MLHHLAGATIHVVNLVNYNCKFQEDGNKRVVTNGPRREKTCLRGSRQNEFQTGLLSY